MPISNLLGPSIAALSAYQAAINTTSRNISNVDNPNYVRRRTDVGSLLSPISGLAFNEKDTINRLDSGFIQNQIWYKNQFLGKHESDELIYSQIESLYNEPGESGIASIMDGFWNAWSDLANDPESNTAKSIVKDKGVLLTNTFHQVSTDFKNMQTQVGNEIVDTISTINNLLGQIKSINEKVGANYSYDLADSRDSAISQLSKLINIDVSENTDNVVSITTGGDVLVPLVNGDFVNELTATSDPYAETFNVTVSFSEGGSIGAVTGGTLGSLLDIHNDSIPGYLDQLDTLAVGIADSVNDIHKLGYNLDDVTGTNFFNPTVDSVGSFSVNDDIVADPTLIATSSNPSEAGNGEVAADLADLQFGYNLQKQKFSDFYSSMVSQVGSKVQEARFLHSSQDMVMKSLQNQRDSISGVSIDEEMTNLIKYEQAYQASSRMIAVADELIKSVLALI